MKSTWPSATPHWVRELDRYIGTKGQLIIHGNTKDIYFYPVKEGESEEREPQFRWSRSNTLRDALCDIFVSRSYNIVASYNILDGLRFAKPEMVSDFTKAVVENEVSSTGTKKEGLAPAPRIEDPTDRALQQFRVCIANNLLASAIIIEHASQLTSGPVNLDRSQRTSYLRLLRSGIEAATAQGTGLKNILVLLADKLTDVPAWLFFDNPSVTTFEIARPTGQERRHFFAQSVPLAKEFDITELSDLTEGMAFRDLLGVFVLSQSTTQISSSKKLVDLYKFGIRESQWDNVVSKLIHAEECLQKRVMGQPYAVMAVADVLRRASLHLSGAHHATKSRPRGVLFFAGPTGVGKTELAKAIAELVFGTDEACVRFDMSEYSQEHSGDRLLGAPPGYVGYEEGGQLTNSIKKNPFCVLLFDEIEKAHPSILDKFLQIIEDGRMTDGRGETVYFGESIVIFTSNAGIYEIDPSTGRAAINPEDRKPILRVDPELVTEYGVLRDKVTEGVSDYFKHYLGRPELLNRIGKNIVVFDFIRGPLMRQILADKVLPAIQNHVKERLQLCVSFSDDVIDQLVSAASCDVGSGGRGVGNLSEIAILNPLSRVLFTLVAEGNSLIGRHLKVTKIVAPEVANHYHYNIEWSFCDA